MQRGCVCRLWSGSGAYAGLRPLGRPYRSAAADGDKAMKCDLCGKSISPDVGTDLVRANRDRWDVEIKRSQYDRDGGSVVEAYTCCGDCWDSKVVALFGKPPTPQEGT